MCVCVWVCLCVCVFVFVCVCVCVVILDSYKRNTTKFPSTHATTPTPKHANTNNIVIVDSTPVHEHTNKCTQKHTYFICMWHTCRNGWQYPSTFWGPWWRARSRPARMSQGNTPPLLPAMCVCVGVSSQSVSQSLSRARSLSHVIGVNGGAHVVKENDTCQIYTV